MISPHSFMVGILTGGGAAAVCVVVVAVLFPGFGSVSSLWAVAVLTRLVPAGRLAETATEIVIVAELPESMVPRSHVMVLTRSKLHPVP